MIQCSKLSKSFADQQLLEDVTFQISSRDKIGLVGRNGSGKSTLIKMLKGDMEPDSGDISIPRHYRIGYLEQHLKFTQETILDECAEVLGDQKEYELYRVEKFLSGLGFHESDFTRSPHDFSGGYQIRLNLIKLLLEEPDLLLLDEPTNYLDIVSQRWLSDFLKSFQGEVLLITHDRSFMDDVCNHILGIKRKRVRKIRGKTKDYYEQVQLDEENYEKTRLNQEKKKEQLEKFVTRFKAKASKARQAQSKAKLIEKMEDFDELEQEKELSFRFNYEECPGKVPMGFKNLTFAYPDGPTLFQELSFDLGRHDRIGIIGRNGQGKSTLLNVIGGELSPIKGSIQKHARVRLGHFGQTNVERLFPKNTMIQEVMEANPQLDMTTVRTICGTMMFEGDLAEKKISVLSGGEKSRVLLGKILARKTNILLLDEPTNHLDIESIESLAQELQAYPGAIIIVTHSEYLLKKLAKKLIIFHQDKAELFLGGYKDFLKKVGWEEDIQEAPKRKKNKNDKQQRAELIKRRSQELKPLKQKVEKLENDIIKIEELLSEKTKSLESEDDSQVIAQVSAEIGRLNQDLEAIFLELEKESEELDRKEEELAL